MAGGVKARGIALPLLLLAVVIGTQSLALEVLPGDPGYVDPLDLFEPVSRKTEPRDDRVCDSDEHQCHPRSGPMDVPEQEKKSRRDEGKARAPPLKDFHLSRLVAHVLEEFDRIGFKFGRFRLEGRLSEYSVDLLRKYRKGEIQNSHEVYEIMVKLMSVKSMHEAGDNEWSPADELPFVGIANRPWHQDLLFCSLGCAALTFLAFAAVRITTAVHSNFWRTVKWAVLVLFFISVPWEWYRLYSEAQSAHLAEMMKGIPEACQPNRELSAWTYAGMFMRSAFVAAEDPCLKYQKALLVNPLSEVTPLQAIAVAFTRLFTDPLVYVFGALGKCTKALLVELPVVSHVFVAVLIPIFLLFFIVLLVLTTQQYAFRVPFLLSIAPSPTNIVPAIAQRRDDAEVEQLKMLSQELPQIRKLLDDQNQRQQEVMQHIEAGTLGGGRLRVTHSDTGDPGLQHPAVESRRSRSEQPPQQRVVDLGSLSASGNARHFASGGSECDGAGGRPQRSADTPSPAALTTSERCTESPRAAGKPNTANTETSLSAENLGTVLGASCNEPLDQPSNSGTGTTSGVSGAHGSPEPGSAAHDSGNDNGEGSQRQHSEATGAVSDEIPDAGNVADVGPVNPGSND